ncbi:hypothetical protein COX05_02105 [candidate division WWE3 bacterium CG22_combo_CG10-13_8_21_14_all_39_12]|uniref:histidine kinase n=1 Tax=candidate division WWE3 bacterium CG22_combo_CG10-13_8_21_14_all_39_12 TaxID=1975094 RepID=A0A2H0BG20_UNCKA|nr:MAG: hypothetical protein COX05_02105 [candidate division WWE3 bacterium CG22_combo_CG10-13_8_21_14_all_39_12]
MSHNNPKQALYSLGLQHPLLTVMLYKMTGPKIFFSLRFKVLLMLIVIAVVPYIITQFIWEQSAAKLTYDYEAQLLETNTEYVSSTIEEFISEHEINLSSYTYETNQDPVSYIAPILSNYLENDSHTTFLATISEGKLSSFYSHSSNTPPPALVNSIDDISFATQSLEPTDKPIYLETLENNVLMYTKVIEITSDVKTTKIILVGGLDLNEVITTISTFATNDTSSWIIATVDGRPIYSPTNESYDPNTLLNIYRANNNEAEGDVRLVLDENGTPMQQTVLVVPYTYWNIIAIKPLSFFSQQSILNQSQALGAFAIVLIVVFISGFFFSRQLLNPLKDLVKGTEEIQKGNYNYKSNVHTFDELAGLSASFNQMSHEILKNQNELKNDAQTIEAERDKLTQIISGISDAVIVVDLNEKIVLFNKAAEDITGYKNSEVIETTIGKVLTFSSKETSLQTSEVCPINTTSSAGVIKTMSNITLTGKDKKLTIVNLAASHIQDGHIAKVGCILTLHDITQEAELEEMKLDFVSVAAHELRTPLTSIRGYLEFLNESTENLTNDQHRFIDRIQLSVNQLVGHVENLLNVSKIERGSVTINPVPTDWVSNMQSMAKDIDILAKSKGQSIHVEVPSRKLPLVIVDPTRMVEVVHNLLTNAINYSTEGNHTRIWFEVDQDMVITHIGDNGEGIPPKALKHLFTKFYRVGGKLSETSKGTGLGLYISKGIIELHKGEIWVQSKPGVGSIFSFSLPIAKKP